MIVIPHFHQRRMTARNYQCHKRRCQIRGAQKIRENVAFQMIDPDEGNVPGKGQRLRRRNSHQKSPHQARPIGYRHLMDLRQRHPRLPQCLVNHRHDVDNVVAGRDLRYHPAKLLMHGNLRGDNVRQQPSPAAKHRRRRFVAARFNAQRQLLVLLLASHSSPFHLRHRCICHMMTASSPLS